MTALLEKSDRFA
jgi:hypothetical protein